MKSRVARATWVAIVVACFAVATYMINDSYKEWQESPVSTTITTHPITELQFPTVTVCPPKGSNTALNHLLEKVKDVNFTNEVRQSLLDLSIEVFLVIPNKKYVKQIRKFVSVENMRSIVNGKTSLPEINKQDMIILRTSEPEGNFSTPSLGFAGNSYKFELNLPDNIEKLVTSSRSMD